MGQRLVINLISEGKILANAYYHWGAYSSSALHTLKPIIEELRIQEEQNYKPTMLDAVRLLQATKAELPDREFEVMKKLYPNFKRNTEIISRNDGLIGITEKEKETSTYWAEGTIYVDLDNKTFDFDVCCGYNNLELLMEVYEITETKDIPKIIETTFKSFDGIALNEFEDLVALIKNAEDSNSIIRMPDSSYVSIIY